MQKNEAIMKIAKKKSAKNDSSTPLRLFYAKNGSKKQLMFKNEAILKIDKNGHHAKAKAFAK